MRFCRASLLAIGFSVVGLKYGLALGFLLGFLNVIPYLGSMIGLGITLPLAYFQQDGGLYTLAGVIVVFMIVQTIEGYILTPKIMGDRTGLHPMAIIIAVFFWGSALGGILGMILAIPLTRVPCCILASGEDQIHRRTSLTTSRTGSSEVDAIVTASLNRLRPPWAAA